MEMSLFLTSRGSAVRIRERPQKRFNFNRIEAFLFSALRKIPLFEYRKDTDFVPTFSRYIPFFISLLIWLVKLDDINEIKI